jgi:hypothetical protein
VLVAIHGRIRVFWEFWSGEGTDARTLGFHGEVGQPPLCLHIAAQTRVTEPGGRDSSISIMQYAAQCSIV